MNRVQDWAAYTHGQRAIDPMQTQQAVTSGCAMYYAHEGRVFVGYPCDIRRYLEGYLQVGDEVFVWGHAPCWALDPECTDEPFMLNVEDQYTGRSSESLNNLCENWLQTGDQRVHWGATMQRVVGTVQTLRHWDPDDQWYHLDNSGWEWCPTALALDMETHNRRLRDLGLVWPAQVAQDHGRPLMSVDGNGIYW